MARKNHRRDVVQICSKCHTQVDDTVSICPECAAELSKWSTTAVALENIQSNPRIMYVRIAVANDCCPTCLEKEGAYSKVSVPELPIEGCSGKFGCRCFYQPVLEEIYP